MLSYFKVYDQLFMVKDMTKLLRAHRTALLLLSLFWKNLEAHCFAIPTAGFTVLEQSRSSLFRYFLTVVRRRVNQKAVKKVSLKILPK